MGPVFASKTQNRVLAQIGGKPKSFHPLTTYDLAWPVWQETWPNIRFNAFLNLVKKPPIPNDSPEARTLSRRLAHSCLHFRNSHRGYTWPDGIKFLQDQILLVPDRDNIMKPGPLKTSVSSDDQSGGN